jgi:hypothetical protein
LRFVSESLHGAVIDEFEDIPPELLQHYHGVLSKPIHRGSQQTGARFPPEEESDSDGSTASDGSDTESDIGEPEQNPLHEAISSHVSANVKHKAVKCPWHHCPFADLTHVAMFGEALRDVQANGLIPDGYGLNMSSWDGGEYPTSEPVRFGQTKEVLVELLLGIWLPRAITWVQGLYVMNKFRYHLSNE